MSIDYERLHDRLVQQFSLGPGSIHGPDHWNRVKENGLEIAKRNGADETIVRLFAIFHDAKRENEGYDPQHGQRAAELAKSLHGDMFEIDLNSLELLCVACEYHHQGGTTDDLTIGTCWDADRMDLVRVNTIPDPEFMSTEVGKAYARHGGFES